MILSTLILFGSTLISGIVASPVEIVDLAKRAQNVLIGYRTVHPVREPYNDYYRFLQSLASNVFSA
jgi:hypothetical protein